MVDDFLRLLCKSSKISLCSDSVGFNKSHSSKIRRTGFAYDSYRINIRGIDIEHDISMREVYGLDKSLRE